MVTYPLPASSPLDDNSALIHIIKPPLPGTSSVTVLTPRDLTVKGERESTQVNAQMVGGDTGCSQQVTVEMH